MIGPLLKAALIEYVSDASISAPNVCLFQMNPEKVSHNWLQPDVPGAAGTESNNPLAVPGVPTETFSFAISMDADDGVTSGVAGLPESVNSFGVGARLASLEMLLYPTQLTQPAAQASSAPSGLTGTVTNASTPAAVGVVASPSGSSGKTVPTYTLPVVIFVYGPHRVVPVRIQSLTITESLFDTNLHALHAEAQLTLRVLTPAELAAARATNDALAAFAVGSYNYTLGLRQRWALANTAAAAATAAIGLVPR